MLRLPSILVLLALGFGAGAIGALDPNALLGEQLISAVVSVAVGIILFEAGLGLKLSKLTGAVARVSRRLVSLGILVTWAICSALRESATKGEATASSESAEMFPASRRVLCMEGTSGAPGRFALALSGESSSAAAVRVAPRFPRESASMSL